MSAGEALFTTFDEQVLEGLRLLLRGIAQSLSPQASPNRGKPRDGSSKQWADPWLARTRSSGTLYPCAFNEYRYELMRRNSFPEDLPPPGSREAQRFIGTLGEWYEYLEGRPFERGARWQLWRQDDNGGRFVMAEFERRYEAMTEMETMERRGHKQTYWVSSRETPGGGTA